MVVYNCATWSLHPGVVHYPMHCVIIFGVRACINMPSFLASSALPSSHSPAFHQHSILVHHLPTRLKMSNDYDRLVDPVHHNSPIIKSINALSYPWTFHELSPRPTRMIYTHHTLYSLLHVDPMPSCNHLHYHSAMNLFSIYPSPSHSYLESSNLWASFMFSLLVPEVCAEFSPLFWSSVWLSSS